MHEWLIRQRLYNKPFVYLRLLITPLVSVKLLSYKPFVYLLIIPLVSVKSLESYMSDCYSTQSEQFFSFIRENKLHT
jgi:hypothetical protein